MNVVENKVPSPYAEPLTKTRSRSPSHLERLVKEVVDGREVSYTDSAALVLQPVAYSEFNAHNEFKELVARWTRPDPYSSLDFARLWAMALNCKRTLEHGSGALAELGVYRGQSASLLSYYAEKASRKLFLCDTFAGFPEEQFEAEDDRSEGKRAAFKDVTLEAAKTVVGTYHGVRWVVGAFPESITSEMRDEMYSFVSIDCDIYVPVREGLSFFWPWLQPGGMIFVHDYASGYWSGATKAVDEFCQETGAAGCLLPDFCSSFVLISGGRR